MSKLKELEKRLKSEPDNLGLRVAVAGALIEAGRRGEAVELYHSVAIAYRDQGRTQQAVVVCRNLLELAPEDAACQALLATLTAAPEEPPPASRLTPPELPPAVEETDELGIEDLAELGELGELGDDAAVPRRSSIDVTPLPAPMPYHVADPSSLSRPKLRREDLPPSLRQDVVLSDAPFLEIEGIANAAREISASLLAASPPDPPEPVQAAEPDDGASHEETFDADDVVDVTEAEPDDGMGPRRRARIDPHAALEHLGTLRPTVPLGRPVTAPAAGDTGDESRDVGDDARDAGDDSRDVGDDSRDDAADGPRDDADDQDDVDDDDELTLPPKLDAVPHARGVDDEKTRPRGRPPGLAPVSHEPSERMRSQPTASTVADARPVAERARASRLSRPLTGETRSLADRASRGSYSSQSIDLPDPVTEPRNLADLVPSTRASRPLIPESRSLPDRAALSVDPPDPVTEPRNLADRVRRTSARSEAGEDTGATVRPPTPAAAGSREIPRLHTTPGDSSVGTPAHSSVGTPAHYSVGAPVHASVGAPAHASVGAPVHAPVGPSVGAPGHAAVSVPGHPSVGAPGHAAVGAPAPASVAPLASALFAPVPPAQRAALLQRFRRRLAGIGTTVIRRGEAGHGLVLVVRGRLDVHAEGADGSRVSLDAIGPGDHVGEIGLVSRTPAAAYVVAAVDSELLVLAAPDFYELAGELPALWSAVSAVAERRTRDHAQRLLT